MKNEKLLLQVKNVSQIYGSGTRKFTAIENIHLTLHEGEFVSLLGPSGCGKSTLLRIITGLQKPSEGQVLYRGTALQGVNPYASIVFQTFALFPWLNVQENVELALKVKGIPSEQRAKQSVELLDRVGLDGFENAFPRELSGGMRQKVGFARAMAVEPELLCLDEPFSALDVLSAETLRGELLELWLSGSIPTRAILMVSHNIEEAVLMSDRIIVMDKNPGRIIADMKIDLPHPRARKSSEFQHIVDQVYALLAGQTQPDALELGSAPGEPGPTRRLPQMDISDLSGFLEMLNDIPEQKTDLFRLAEGSNMDSDYILRLADAAELLGFAKVTKGDVELTPLGETFAEARILARKEIFATRIRRIPFFQWLLTMLRASDRQRIKWEVVQAALELEFPPDEAERQLEIAVDWGRYAEIIAYDDGDGVIFLESATAAVAN